MAEHAVNSATSAVTSELTSRVFSAMIQRYGKDAATSKKLQRLEMLLIKFHSAVEASEKHNIENSWLLRWRDKLKVAAAQGDEVLARYSQQVKDAQATSNAKANQQQGEAASSSSAAGARALGALSFTRKSLFGIVQGICNARTALFSSVDNDMARLNRTLGSLEMLSPDIGEFIRLLHLEALPKLDQTPHSAALSTKLHGPTRMMMKTKQKKRIKHSTTHTSKPSSEPSLFSFSPPKEEEVELLPPVSRLRFRASFRVQGPQDFTLLQDRLEAAFAEICKAVELADNHDIEDLKWLAYWAGILREAKEQGCDALGTTSACKTVNKEPAVECDEEENELGTFVHRLEVLLQQIGRPMSNELVLCSCYYC